MRKYRTTILFALLSAAVIVFIWTNSCMSREVSGEQSGFIMQILKPLLDPKGVIAEEDFHHAVRKTAHFVEFATLGTLVGGLLASICAKTGRRFVSLPVLIVLLVSVLDEYIQFFADRGSQVTDVILDFAGGLTGLGVTALIALWMKKN